MSLSFSSSVSGIRAAFDVLDSSAHNTANINTDGFKKQNFSLSEGAIGEVVVNLSESTESGPLHQNKEGSMVEASNVSLFEEIVEQMNARHLLSANIAVIKRTDEAQKSLIDIMA
ncbi:MAG: flagellar basal body rod C-terminal domain-containing protein [Candidatus Scalinduaceae bacterium]